MRILVTNDDGIFSEGIKLLARALAPLGEVYVVAPDREQSASGHSLTLSRPLRLRKIEERWYAVDGTPTDCVSLAVQWLLKEQPPELVVSGINFGVNLGNDVTYSGTVSATFEGSLLGIPSVAFSQEIGERFSFEDGRSSPASSSRK
jgi:5'-nucleotidase